MVVLFPDPVRVDGRNLHLFGDPLAPLRDRLPLLHANDYGDRNHVVSWEIVDGTLRLSAVTVETGPSAAVTAQEAFPLAPLPVVASWFTGELRIVAGRPISRRPQERPWAIHAEEEFHLTVHKGQITGRTEGVPSGVLGRAGPFQMHEDLRFGVPLDGRLNDLFRGTGPDGAEVIVKTPNVQLRLAGINTRFPSGPTWLPLATSIFEQRPEGCVLYRPGLIRDAFKAMVLHEGEILERDGGVLLPKLLSLEWDNTVSTVPALVMEPLDGGSGAVNALDTYRLLMALSEAVERGTFDAHGDLKPEHVFVTGDGRIRVCDPAPRFNEPRLRGFTPRYNPFGWAGAAADVAACATMIRFNEDEPGYAWADRVLGPEPKRWEYPDNVLRDRTPPAWVASHAKAAEMLLRDLNPRRSDPAPASPVAPSARRQAARLPAAGDQFGPYLINRELGRGGMGVVYEAVDRRIDRPVAIKVILPRLAGDEAFVRRFEREASILARIRSRCIVPLHEYGEHEEILYLVTDYFPDGDLAHWLDRHGPLDARHALTVIADVTEALDDAHRAGVVHRDIKTSNVLLWDRKDRLLAYLGDFGIAGQAGSDLTATGTLMGSLATMAPELHHGSRADQRSDLYAVGCVLWACLTGAMPYVGNPQELIYAHLTRPVPQLEERSAFEPALNRLLHGTMAKDPAHRFPDARTLMTRLRAAAELAPHTVIAPETIVNSGPAAATLPLATDPRQMPTDQGPATEPPKPPPKQAPTKAAPTVVAPNRERPAPPGTGPERQETEPQIIRTGLMSRRGTILLLVVLSLVGAAAWWTYSTGRTGFGPASPREEQAAATIADGAAEDIEWADSTALQCAATELVADLGLERLQADGVLDSDLNYQGNWDTWGTQFHRDLLSCDDSWPARLTDHWGYGTHAEDCFKAQPVGDMASVLAADLADVPANFQDTEQQLAECIHPPVAHVRVAEAPKVEAPYTHRLFLTPAEGPLALPDTYLIELAGSEFTGSGAYIDVYLPTEKSSVATVFPVYDYDFSEGRPLTGDPTQVTLHP